MRSAPAGRFSAFFALILLLCPAAWAGDTVRVVDARFDPAMELMGVVELLSGRAYGETEGYAALDVKEAQQALKRFAPWRGAAAPVWAAGPKGEKCSFLTRGDALVRLDMTPLPEFKPRDLESLPKYFVDCFGSRQDLNEWLDGLRKFSSDSDFPEYFAAKTARLEPFTEKFRRDVAAVDLIGKIERYTGLPFHGIYALRLSSYHEQGSQTNSVKVLEDGSYQIISIVGPNAIVDGLPYFEPNETLSTGWHELAHGVLDSVSDIYRTAVRRRAAVQRSLPWNCYGGWEQCFKENMVRAVMFRLRALETGRAPQKREIEDPKKYPYLLPMVERLKEYEADRARYPTLAHFYPRLLELFPVGREIPAAPLVLSGPDDPGPDWVSGASAPFKTPGQREKALELLDIMLDGRADPDPDVLLRRCVLRLHAKLYQGALADAEAAERVRPGSAAALYLAARAAEALDRGPTAVTAIKRAAEACAVPGADEALCRNVLSRTGRTTAGQALPATGESDRTFTFSTDPRIELLAVIRMLAEPEAFRVHFASATPAFADFGRRAWKTFAPFAGHPAVADLRRLKKSGVLSEATAGMFTLTAPPELEILPYEAAVAMVYSDVQFLKNLRDFSRTSGFMAFYRDNAALYARLLEHAHAELRRELRPLSVVKYLRQEEAWRHQIILSPLLPSEMATNALIHDPEGKLSIRIRTAVYAGQSLLEFDDFAASAAHEIAHDFLDPLAFAYSRELEGYSSLRPAGCTDSWMGCVLEHVDLAVTLRAVAAERGEAAYKTMLAEYSRGEYPYVARLCQRLKEWESTPGISFERFYPRLVSVFREAMPKGVKLPTPLSASGPSSPLTAPAAPAAASMHNAEPRLELAAALIGLATQAEPSGPFIAFSTHPAVEKVRKILHAGKRALPAQLMLYVSAPPALLPLTPLPPDYAALAGGKEEVADFYAVLRDFAAKTNFDEYYRSQAASQAAVSRRYSDHLKSLSPFGERVVVSALLPSQYWARLIFVSRSGAPEVWSFMSEALLVKNSARDPNAPVEIGMAVDPRVELLSVLLLLQNQAGATAEPKSPYRRSAELWFAPFASEPAVAQTSAILKISPNENLPAQFILHLSTPPNMVLEESMPSGYIDAAGGEAVLTRYLAALNAFSKKSRFPEFYEAHRADYEAFEAQARKEANSAISFKAVQSYLGAGFQDSYSFILSPLLPEERALNVTFLRKGRAEEVRLRPARYSTEHGLRFLFDQFGSSLAHELVHIVTNPMLARFDSKGARAPAGCNDRQDGSWSSCMQEHLVYAVTLRILAKEAGEKAYRAAMREYSERGFPYLEPLGERLKEYEAARDLYKTLKEFYPRIEALLNEKLPAAPASAAPASADSRVRELKDQGVKDFVEGRFADAAAALKAALELAPRDSEAFLNLAVVYEKLQLRNEALECYGRAIEFTVPNSARARDVQIAALSSRATLLFSLGRAEDARQDLRRALKTAPSDWDGRGELERRLAP